MQADPVLIGLGARTPVGRGMASAAAAVRAGLVRFAEHPVWCDDEGEAYLTARASWLEPEDDSAARLRALADPAMREALWPLGRAVGPWPAISVDIAVPAPRPGLPDGIEAALTRRTRALLSKLGHTAAKIAFHHDGIEALARARTACLAGAGLCLVGGVDSYLSEETLRWLDAGARITTERNSAGFVPGEAAGFVLLCDPSLARARGLAVRGTLVDVLLADDAEPGRLADVVLAAATRRPADAAFDLWYSDFAGELARADDLGFTQVRMGAVRRRLPTPGFAAESWGDVGAATAPLLLGLAVEAAERGHAAGPWALATTGAGGVSTRAGAAVLHLPGTVRIRSPS